MFFEWKLILQPNIDDQRLW